MVLIPRTMRRFFALLASGIALTSTPYAQTPIPKSDAITSADRVLVAPYQSAFESYRPFTDEAITNWKAANDTTARIGGWREYARQAQQPDNIPAATLPTKADVPAPQAKP